MVTYSQIKTKKTTGTNGKNHIKFVEYRSDTFTRPDDGMLNAMMGADVGDDVYGEDPSVNELQEKVARLLGKEAALFVSSGTLGNLIAMMAHCNRGEEVITGDQYHVFIDEAMGASVLGGIAMQPLACEADNSISLDNIRRAIKPDDIHCPISKLISLENTVHGRVQSLSHFQEIRKIADSYQLKMHLDGARLMNAVIASNASAKELATPFESVSLCLSKGLGAPIGSVLAGSAPFINKALRLRKLLGGGTRQAGYLARAGIWALDNNVSRLKHDHDHAAQLYQHLIKYGDAMESPPSCHTNMIFLELKKKHHLKLQHFLRKRHIIFPDSYPTMRLVLHKDISGDEVATTMQAITDYMKTHL
jgi:threonine aldolase